MKKVLICFSLLCFLPVFNLNGYAFDAPNTIPVCKDIEVKLIVENIIWNADAMTIFPMLGPPEETDNIGFDFDNIDDYLIGFSRWEIPDLFHIVKISFDIPADFLEFKNLCTSDISIHQYGQQKKPIIIVFTQDTNQNIKVILNQNTLASFKILSSFTPNVNAIIGGGGGPGVATTVGVMARTLQHEVQVDESCIEVVMTNKITNVREGINCIYDNIFHSDCRVIDTSQSSKIKIYPNPVSNDLFIQKNDIDVSKIEILTIQGKVVSEKISTRDDMSSIQINTSNLMAGIYLLKIETPYSSMMEKIVIQNE